MEVIFLTKRLNTLCIFCGSSFGRIPEYREITRELGKYLVSKDIKLVYGGGNVGLMGELARSIMDNGGHAIGVIPKRLYEKVEHVSLSKLHIVDDMHQRKSKMYELSDGFIALPGGIGTIEELTEVFTWHQLGYHNKPVGILNINNYFDNYIKLLSHMVKEKFLKEEHKNIIIHDENPYTLIEKMESFKPVKIEKWIKD